MTVGQRIRAAIEAKGVKDVWVAAKNDDVILTPEQRNALEVFGIVVQRLTAV